MKHRLLLTAALLAATFCFGQKDFNELLLKIDKDLETADNKFPKERIALFTDKSEYFSRGALLFSTFLTLNGKASPLSRTVYLELGDYTGKVVAKRMLAVNKGTSQGLIEISPDWPSGPYVINAYSLWMKNTPQLVAQKQILVLGKDYLDKPFVLQQTAAGVDRAEFVPEGRSWAAGASQNFVLRLTDKNNLPLERSFSLLENGKEVTQGKTDRNGFAKLQLTPAPKSAYQIKIAAQTLPLSLPANEGLALSFNTENKSKLFVNLQKSAAVSGNKFLLVGYNDEKLCYQSVFDFGEGATATAIPKTKLPHGLVHFLLFDEALRVMAQRDVWLFEPAGLSAEIASQGALRLRNDSLSEGTVSISLKDSATVLGWRQNLLSMLPGLQNEYNVQVDDLSAASLQMIDMLLQLQPAPLMGKPWSVSDPLLQYPVESGITVRGNIKPFAGDRNPAGYKAELIIKGEDSTTAFTTVRTTANGDFIIPDLSFQQGARIFFQGGNGANKRELLNMQLSPGYFDTLSRLSLPPLFRFEKQSATSAPEKAKAVFAQLDNDPRYKVLEMVVVKAKKRSPLDSLKQVYLTPMFDDGNATLLQPQGNYINIWQYLRNAAPGLKVDGNLDNPSVYFSRYQGQLNPANNSGESLSESFGEQSGVLFFLNEVQVSKDVVSTLNTDDIALVAVNRQPMAALGAYNGSIVIYTKKGVSVGNTAKSMAVEKRSGYAPFVSPYRLYESQYKPGATVYFGKLTAPFQLSLPAQNNYRIIALGWNKAGELAMSVN